MFVAVAAVSIAHLTSGGGPACSIAAPVPTLSGQLEALGGFDQPYDPGDMATLDSLAVQAAQVTSHNLIGATPSPSVSVASADPAKPDALVIPLLYASGSANAGRLAGIVVFLRDCAGRVYYSATWDFTSAARPFASYPVVSEAAAATELGTGSPQLVYSSSPAAPLWRRPDSDDMLPAGPLYPA